MSKNVKIEIISNLRNITQFLVGLIAIILVFILVLLFILKILFFKETNGQFSKRTTSSSLSFSSKEDEISMFSDEKYYFQCYGSCFCGKNEERETRITTITGVLTTRRLIFIASVVSSVIAYDLSKKYFASECEEYFSIKNECGGSSSSSFTIHSEVESCEKIQSEKNNQQVLSSSSTSSNEVTTSTKIKQSFQYLCSGNCLPRNWKLYYNEEFLVEEPLSFPGDPVNHYPNEIASLHEISLDYGCEKVNLKKIMISEIEDEEELKDSFIFHELNPFCVNYLKPEDDIETIIEQEEEEDDDDDDEDDESSFCVGEVQDENKSVICILQ